MAFIFDFNVSTSWVLLVNGGLLVIVFALAAVSVYRAARNDRDTSVERSELNSILASLNDGLIVYEADFRVIFFNPAAERLFKLDAKSVIGHVFSPRDVEREGWRTLIQIIFPSLAPRVIARTKEGEYPQVVDISFTDPPARVPRDDRAGDGRRRQAARVHEDHPRPDGAGARAALQERVRDRRLAPAARAGDGHQLGAAVARDTRPGSMRPIR